MCNNNLLHCDDGLRPVASGQERRTSTKIQPIPNGKSFMATTFEEYWDTVGSREDIADHKERARRAWEAGWFAGEWAYSGQPKPVVYVTQERYPMIG
jgi:hypothetical protein